MQLRAIRPGPRTSRERHLSRLSRLSREGRSRRRRRGPAVLRRHAARLLLVSGTIVALVAFGWAGIASAAGASAATGPAPLRVSAATTSPAARLDAKTSLVTCLKAHGVSIPKNFKYAKSLKSSKSFKPPKGFTPSKAKHFTASKAKSFTPPKGAKGAKVSKKFLAALRDCGGGAFPFGGAASKGAVSASALKAYLSCLSDNGVKVPKKDDTKRTVLAGLAKQAKFAAASKKCSVLLPTHPPTGSSSTSSTS